MSSLYKYLIVENVGSLRKIIISNPKKKNALNVDAYMELTGSWWNDICALVHLINTINFWFRNDSDALNNANNDDTVSIVALTGDGYFYSSGNDISAFTKVDDPKSAVEKSAQILGTLTKTFIRFPKLLICVLNGPCIGISATLAVLCDIIYAVDTVRLLTCKLTSKID